MEPSVKACILSAYAPGTVRGESTEKSPYPKGQQLLYNSLIHHGFRHDIMFYQDWPNDHYDKGTGYNVKAAAFHEVLEMGYERILWLDSSVWAIQNPAPIFDVISNDGWYFWRNGFNCALTCDDHALRYFQINRDQAEQMPDITSSMFGVHMGNPKAQEFMTRWLATAKDGLWASSRFHNNGSQDPRFLFDRQDQSCASVIWNQLGMTAHDPNVYSAIANDRGEYPESVIFVMRGL
jgi:hypothetical protein